MDLVQAQILPDLLALGVVNLACPGRSAGVHDRPGGIEGDVAGRRDDLADLERAALLIQVDVPKRGDVDDAVASIASGAAAVPTSPLEELSVMLLPVTLTVPLGKPGSASRLPVASRRRRRSCSGIAGTDVPSSAPEPRLRYTPWLPA